MMSLRFDMCLFVCAHISAVLRLSTVRYQLGADLGQKQHSIQTTEVNSSQNSYHFPWVQRGKAPPNALATRCCSW